MRRIKEVPIIGSGSLDDPYRPQLVFGVDYSEGDIIIAEIEIDKRGKPKRGKVKAYIITPPR
ncbi:MAG: hypothetical protein QXV79_04485 [Thermofilaceae archaeon]